MDFALQQATSEAWVETVLNDFDSFLLDHANCEKKASGMAMSMISHYPDQPELVKEMTNLAVEELHHFRDVIRIVLEKGLRPASDTKDQYVRQLHKLMGEGKDAYFLDRLLIASIVEARGAERFDLVAKALPEGKMKVFYRAIADSEKRHYQLFLQLAESYFDNDKISQRLQTLLKAEAEIINNLPLQPALH